MHGRREKNRDGSEVKKRGEIIEKEKGRIWIETRGYDRRKEKKKKDKENGIRRAEKEKKGQREVRTERRNSMDEQTSERIKVANSRRNKNNERAKCG